jgi:hypothetical protein
LAAELQEAAAALRGVDGQRKHRWPAFLLAQAHPDPSLPQTERLKGFAEVVQEAEAPNSMLDIALEPDDDAFVWVAPGRVRGAQAA